MAKNSSQGRGGNDFSAMMRYHAATRHSRESVSRNVRMLDFDNMPIPFKIYRDLPRVPLPKQSSPPETLTDAAILGVMNAVPATPAASATLDLAMLSEWLRFSAGITKTKRYPGGTIDFRAASCTGALYHIDLYFACSDLPNLPAGLYHYSPHDHSLRLLRAGDVRGVLVDAAAGEATAAAAPVIFIFADTFWRNSWKYEARAYRHTGWDTGTILANFLALANHFRVPANLLVGFVDLSVNRLLGMDGEREAAVALIPVGFQLDAPGAAFVLNEPPRPTIPDSIRFETEPLSPREIEEPLIRAMHAASSFNTADDVLRWRSGRLEHVFRDEAAGRRLPLPSAVPLRSPSSRDRSDRLGEPRDAAPCRGLGDAIRRRGSTREFARAPIALEDLAATLQAVSAPIPADFRGPAASWNEIYLIVNAVDGLESGAWVFNSEAGILELLRAGDFRREARELGLGQDLAGDASVNVYFLADLEKIGAAFGNRGYRAAQLEAGVMGGRIYLAAYARGLGATGLTFFDDDVSRFFSPRAAGKSVTFLTLLGRSARSR